MYILFIRNGSVVDFDDEEVILLLKVYVLFCIDGLVFFLGEILGVYFSLEVILFEVLRFFEIFLGVDLLLVFWLDIDVFCFFVFELVLFFLEGVEFGIGFLLGKCFVEFV